jgi:hypothetical protein
MRSRLACGARQLLRCLLFRRKRANLINAAREGLIRERLQVDLGVDGKGSQVDCRSGMCDLHRHSSDLYSGMHSGSSTTESNARN